jgi:hypothetical protein
MARSSMGGTPSVCFFANDICLRNLLMSADNICVIYFLILSS